MKSNGAGSYNLAIPEEVLRETGCHGMGGLPRNEPHLVSIR